MEGWIKLHRKLVQSNMYKSLNSKQRDVMFQCLMLANHSEREWSWGSKIYKCNSGQFITSLESLAQHCAKDVKIQSVRTALALLEKWGFLTNQSTKTGRLITIKNWDKYQKDVFVSSLLEEEKPEISTKILTNNQTDKATDDLTDKFSPISVEKSGKFKYKDLQSTKILTNNQTDKATDDLTDSQQRANKELTTNKNVNNKKNDLKKQDKDKVLSKNKAEILTPKELTVFFNEKFKITRLDDRLTIHTLEKLIKGSSFDRVKDYVFNMPVEGTGNPIGRLINSLTNGYAFA